MPLPSIQSENGRDTSEYVDSSMIQDKLTEIFVRLGQLDSGQIHMIERLAQLTQETQQTRDKLHTLEARVMKVELNLTDYERRAKPWRTFWISFAAAWCTSVGTYLAIHIATR